MNTTKQKTTFFRISNAKGDGRWLLGDLCYLIKDQEEWMGLLNQGFLKEEAGVYELRGYPVFMISTIGDGFFGVDLCGEEWDSLMVDSGSLGIIPWELAEKTCKDPSRLGKNHIWWEETENVIEVDVEEESFYINGELRVERNYISD